MVSDHWQSERNVENRDKFRNNDKEKKCVNLTRAEAARVQEDARAEEQEEDDSAEEEGL